MGLKEKFLSIYANLPVGIRSELICVIGNETYSWSVIKIEVDNDTQLARTILKKMAVDYGVL